MHDLISLIATAYERAAQYHDDHDEICNIIADAADHDARYIALVLEIADAYRAEHSANT